MKYFVTVALIAALLISNHAHGFEAGAAKVDITPAPGVPMNGYPERMGRDALGIHDPLTVRCLYLDDGETSVYLVSADLHSITRELRDSVLRLTGISGENIILTATHTYNGPGGMSNRFINKLISGRYMPELVETTAQKFKEAIDTAYEARERATVGFSTGTQTNLSKNRRVEGGPIDSQIGVIRVDDPDGNIISIITNFAAQPMTAPASGIYQISADYPGYYYTELEKMAGSKCVAMFLNGAQANQQVSNPEYKDDWGISESIGKMLSRHAMKIAANIKCGKSKLSIGIAEPDLPLSIGKSFLPSKTLLQTLEIDDLLLTFFPGEPCVELGLELRKRALNLGYKSHFSVSPANDYLFFFVPRTYYSMLEYETGMNFYGPRIEDWFYENFTRLSSRGESETLQKSPAANTVEEIEGGYYVKLEGSTYDIGYQRGVYFKESIGKSFQDKIYARLDSGEYIPDVPLWNKAPSFLNVTPLALMRLSIGSRPMLSRIADNVFSEIEGIADGSGLPFDAVWLMQCTPVFDTHSDINTFYRAPFCTVFAAVGDRAGADDLLVGRNLDWPVREDANVVMDITPDFGHRFIQVGFPWNVGVFTGMNDAGIVICAEKMEKLGEPRTDGTPVEIVLRNIMIKADNVEDAIVSLKSVVRMKGYHILVAGPEKLSANVFEYGDKMKIRKLTNGLLPGADPRSELVDPESQKRYTQVLNILQDERIIAVTEIEDALKYRDPDVSGMGNIFNENTQHSVVFEPRALRIHVAFPSEDGKFGNYNTISMEEDAS